MSDLTVYGAVGLAVGTVLGYVTGLLCARLATQPKPVVWVVEPLPDGDEGRRLLDDIADEYERNAVWAELGR